MSGALAVVASRSERGYSVTMGQFGTIYGYIPSQGEGAIDGVLDVTSTFRGHTITHVSSDTSSYDLSFSMQGTGFDPPVTDLFAVVVQTTSGGFSTFLSSDATTSLFANIRNYRWGDGSSAAWTATSPSPRLMRLSY